jgi:hypothetical protein
LGAGCLLVAPRSLDPIERNPHFLQLSHHATGTIRQSHWQWRPAPRKGTAREQYPYRPGFTRSNPTDNSRIGQVRLRVQPRTNSILAESNLKLILKPSEPFPLQSPPNSFTITRRGGIVNGGSWRRIGSSERGATSKHPAPKEEKEGGLRGGAQRARGNHGNGSKLRRKERRSSNRNESKDQRHSPRRRRHSDSGKLPPHSGNNRCILCEGEHFIRRCPYREEAKRVALKKLACKRGSDSKDKKRKKAYTTEEITIRAESAGGEDILSSDSERAFVALADDNARLEPLNISRHAQCGDGSLNVTGIGTPTVECSQDRQVASAKITGSYCRKCTKKQWEILCSGKNSGCERQYILSNKITVADRVTKPLPRGQLDNHWDELGLIEAYGDSEGLPNCHGPGD